jgi:hypothetical protein
MAEIESENVVETPSSESGPSTEISVEERIQKEVEKQVAGLKANNQALKEEKRKFQDRAKLIEDLGGEDSIQQLMEMRSRLQEDEDTKLFLSGEREKYNERITNRVREDADARMRSLQEKYDSALNRISEVESRYNNQQLSFVMNDATQAAGVNPRLRKAVEGQLRDQVFYDADSGQVLVRDELDPSSVRYGREGKPMTVTELVELMREDQPELFLQSTGANATGSSALGNPVNRQQIRQMTMADYVAARKAGRI